MRAISKATVSIAAKTTGAVFGPSELERPRWKRFLSPTSSAFALAAVAACGGSSIGGGEPTDTTAPVISLSAAALSVDGGETVPITVSATDARDGNVDYRLTCSAGTLTGNLLVTPVVTADTPITCTATASDRAGNAATQTLTLTARTSVATLTVPNGIGTAAAGQLTVLQATNLTLAAETYAATLDGAPVTLRRLGGGALAFQIPLDMASGVKRLSVQIGTRTFTFQYDVTATAPIADARAVVEQSLGAARSRLVSALTTAPASDRALIQSQIVELETAIGRLSQVSASEMSIAARTLVANRLVQDKRQSLVTAECSSAYNLLLTEAGFLAVTVAGAGAGTLLAGTMPLLGLAIAVKFAAQVRDQYDLMVAASTRYSEACLVENIIEYEQSQNQQSSQSAGNKPVLAKALAAEARLGFSNKRPSNVSFTRRLAVDPTLRTEVSSKTSLITTLLSALPFRLGTPGQLEASLVAERTERIPASELIYAGSSNGGILGAASRTSSGLSITFTADQSITQNTDFSFTVSRTSGPPITIPAQLVVNLPTVEDAAVTVSQGVVTGSLLTVRGADRLEVVQQPTKGTVTLRNDGNFTYVPSALAFGEDRFTYRGVNAEGQSRVATVLIAIVRRFEGAWTITSRSTTTAESRPGLCPTENRTFTVNVAKISDAQYTTVYQGSTITLTMANRDDPAGLSGSGSASYAQDGGTTTETLSIAVPNSATLTGSGTFRYTNPSASCSGTLSFTGRR